MKRKLTLEKSCWFQLLGDDRFKVFSEQGFTFNYDPPGDDDCQFAALAVYYNVLEYFAYLVP